MRKHGWLIGLLALVIPPVLHAQLRGVIRDGPTRAPLGGAVVSVLDAAGATTARAISGADGRFNVAIDARAAKLRVTRIGYRPAEPTLPAAGASLELAMDRIPPMLTAVHVTDNEMCPGSEDRGTAFQLWDQARAGLLTTIVARELNPANAKTVMYESKLTPNDERVREQTKHINAGRTRRPFVAAQTPLYFARHGYILDDPSARIYNGPDADVLLDESFATTHCFHVQAADAAHQGQVGLAFSPAPGRDTLADVTGVIWLDAAVPQLRSLDFLYTALERAAMNAKSGGHIEFRTMANGVAFIERWHLRFPMLEIVPMTSAASRAPRDQLRPITRQERTDTRVHELIQAGGIVLDAKWDDGTEFHDAPTLVRGTVTQRKTKAPIANAIVTLLGTMDTVVTDANGEFELNVIPGKYSLSVRDTTLTAYAQARLVSQSIEATRAQTTLAHVELAPIGDVIDDICRGVQVYEGQIVLLGHVFAPDRARLPNVAVTATWQQGYAVVAGSVATRTARRDSDVDDEGRFVLCGIQREHPIQLRLSSGRDGLADTTIRIDAGELTQPFEWRLAPLGTKPPTPRP
jgi:hypothetical protein